MLARHLRGALCAAACAVTLLAGAAATAPAVAGPPSPAAAAVRPTDVQESRARDQVDSFVYNYREAVLGQHTEGKSPMQVREDYLAKDLDTALDDWGAQHQADPVFRAQNTPDSWSLRTAPTSPEGHSTVILTENWADGTTTDVWYQVVLDDLLIDGLTDPPAPAS
ncbi:hypothetical protein [Kitasatospora sp. NPDC094015]|uniref:hypothetical protein n=1 Tax=Kitasatospora sp. NPDC094015 TaxID=3155205 RepID=UPI00332700D6